MFFVQHFCIQQGILRKSKKELYNNIHHKYKCTTKQGVMADILGPNENSTTNGDVSNTTELEIHETLTSSRDREIARILDLVIRPVLIVFETIGNGLSFYIMRQGSLKKMSTCFYLSILALADTSKCLVFCFCLISPELLERSLHILGQFEKESKRKRKYIHNYIQNVMNCALLKFVVESHVSKRTVLKRTRNNIIGSFLPEIMKKIGLC